MIRTASFSAADLLCKFVCGAGSSVASEHFGENVFYRGLANFRMQILYLFSLRPAILIAGSHPPGTPRGRLGRDASKGVSCFSQPLSPNPLPGNIRPANPNNKQPKDGSAVGNALP